MINTLLYLDSRFEKSNGTSSMKLRISVKSAAAFIPLNLDLPSEQWDPMRRVVKKNCPNARKLNEYLQRRKAQIDDYIRELILEGATVKKSAIEIRDLIMEHFDPKPSKGTFFLQFVKFSESHESPRTRKIYATTLDSMRKYCPNIEEMDFEDITKAWLDDYFIWMADNGRPNVNARNIMLRNIRAAFNNAIDNELTTYYPFRKYKIKHVPTRKRSLSAEQLRSIFDADVPSWEQKYVDAFKLIFLLIGINTVDLLSLRREDINGDYVTYIRAKTKRLYNIKLEPEAREIFDKYPGAKKLLSWDEGCVSYLSWTANLNRRLSEIFPGLTSYYARHSWATIAANDLDIQKDTIAAALGHGASTVTDIYIDFDHKKVDEANRRVIDWVLYGKK